MTYKYPLLNYSKSSLCFGAYTFLSHFINHCAHLLCSRQVPLRSPRPHLPLPLLAPSGSSTVCWFSCLFRKTTTTSEGSKITNRSIWLIFINIASTHKELLKKIRKPVPEVLNYMWILLICAILWINWASTVIAVLTIWFPVFDYSIASNKEL